MAICVPRSSVTQGARIQRVSFRQAATDLRRSLAEQCQDRFGLPVCKAECCQSDTAQRSGPGRRGPRAQQLADRGGPHRCGVPVSSRGGPLHDGVRRRARSLDHSGPTGSYRRASPVPGPCTTHSARDWARPRRPATGPLRHSSPTSKARWRSARTTLKPHANCSSRR